MNDNFLKSLIVEKSDAEREKDLKRMFRQRLHQFLKTSDYKKVKLNLKGKARIYRITCVREGRIYVINDCYGAYPANGINSKGYTLKELKDKFQLAK
jgi:hypothetical protein